MGLGGMICSSSTYDTGVKYFNSTPDPTNYKILKTLQIRNFMAVWIKYPTVKNYEGNKILLLRNITEEQLFKLNIIDPHFCENKTEVDLVARFEPTEYGWGLCLKLISIS